MKVTTNTPDLLIVEDRPVWIALGIIVLILAFVGAGIAMLISGQFMGLFLILAGGGMGLLGFWAFVRRVQVVFHRPEAYVEFRRRNIFRATTVRHRLDEIARAEVAQSFASNDTPTRRVELVVTGGQSAGRHPVTLAYSSGPSHDEVAGVINAWLAKTR